MLINLVTVINEIFPSVTQETASNAIRAISENFKGDSNYIEFCSTFPLDQLSQGDVIDNLLFCFVDEIGNLRKVEARGMLLSVSCDVDKDAKEDNIIVAAMFPLEVYEKKGFDKHNIINNNYSGLFYVPSTNSNLNEYVIDLKLITSIHPKLIKMLITERRKVVLTSLNQLGYYLLLCKLSIHFLRPEDTVTQESRENIA